MDKKLNFKLINRLILLVFIIILFTFLNYIGVITKIVSLLLSLIPFYLSIFISWIMLPFASLLHEKLKVSTKVANFLAILFNIIIVLIIFLVILPMIVIQMTSLSEQATSISIDIQEIIKEILFKYNINQDVINGFLKILNEKFAFSNYFNVAVESVLWLWNFFYGFVGILLQIFIGYIISFYFMSDLKIFVSKLVRLFSKKNYDNNIKLISDISKNLQGYIKGLWIICLFITIMVTIGCYLVGIPYPLLFGILAGIVNVIPFLGPVIAAVPVVLIALSKGIDVAFYALIMFVVVQTIESNFLQPRIMSKSIKIHPVTIMIGLIVFNSIFGFVGMIIATPCLAIVSVIIKHLKLDINI